MTARLILVALSLATAAAGCVGAPADIAPASEDPAAALDAVPTTEELAGSITLSAATPARTINNGGAFSHPLTVIDTHTGFVIEVVWEAATPASESLSVWVREAGVGSIPPSDPANLVTAPGPVAQVSGASPLRIALPADAFPATGDYEIIVRAAAEPVGVAANQPFTAYVTSFDAIPFDDAFTALEESHHG